MNIQMSKLAQLALAAATWLYVGPTTALDIVLPPETASYKASTLPGFELVQRNCMACHAAQYVSTQPPASARPYWEATVKKMKKPFGAQFDDRDIAPMVDYLVRTYGAERNATPGAPAAR